MNDNEQRYVKIFCAIFILALAALLLITVLSSFGLIFSL
jgi:hypothetical protein